MQCTARVKKSWHSFLRYTWYGLEEYRHRDKGIAEKNYSELEYGNSSSPQEKQHQSSAVDRLQRHWRKHSPARRSAQFPIGHPNFRRLKFKCPTSVMSTIKQFKLCRQEGHELESTEAVVEAATEEFPRKRARRKND